jgi:hypothetical protein
MSCFDGQYVTGDVTQEYLDRLETARRDSKPGLEDVNANQLNLQRPARTAERAARQLSDNSQQGAQV